jgi:hypothetical protein
MSQKERDALGEAAIAYRDLATCYRIGKAPSEALWKALDAATRPLAEYLARRDSPDEKPATEGLREIAELFFDVMRKHVQDCECHLCKKADKLIQVALSPGKLLAGRVWKCAACGEEVKGENLVILPRNTYFYHEKFSGEICGRYEEVAAQPPQQGEV